MDKGTFIFKQINNKQSGKGIIDKFLKLGGDPNTRSKSGYFSLIQRIITLKDESSFKLLIDAGVDLKQKHYDYDNLLVMAARFGTYKMVKTLLELGLDPNAKVGYVGDTTLYLAIRHGDSIPITKLLLKYGARVSMPSFTKKSIFTEVDKKHNELYYDDNLYKGKLKRKYSNKIIKKWKKLKVKLHKLHDLEQKEEKSCISL